MNFFNKNDHKNLSDVKKFSSNKKILEEPNEDDNAIEAILFTSVVPITTNDLKKSCPNISDLAGALTRIKEFYKDRGINLVKIKNSYAFRTAPRYSYFLKEYVEKKSKLSKAAKETLAVIAYNQPITRSEIESIRGVSLYKGLIDSLLETGWISLGARKDGPGRPFTFVTTNNFLDYFGLQTVKDMPNFCELREAGFLGKKTEDVGIFE